MFLNGERVATTPTVLRLTPGRRHVVRVTWRGRTRTVPLEPRLQETYLALDLLPGLALAGGSVAIVSACDDGLSCLALAPLGAAGVTAGLLAAGGATATDAVTGAWTVLRPGVVEVRLE